ncbi:flavodoxin family protein [Duncaniella muris]|uniref:flavodoxin family protein n=1 Tax=Duncaniella muris TaxID=2094150 RepID=UPI0027352749|nr:flavodoxin family protein [Duncaniella muris]
MKKVIVVNGSPRRNGKTHRMADSVVADIQTVLSEVEVKWYDLYEFRYSGCRSCFACKAKDDLSAVLDQIADADCLIVASPVYLMDVSGQTRSFAERLCFSLGSYEKGYRSLAKKNMPVVTVYTMNALPEMASYRAFDNIEYFLGHIFSLPRRLCALNIYQFQDYTKYVVETFSELEKAYWRDVHFKDDLQAAFDAGKDIARQLHEG